jgi:hypothetical protein
VWRCSKDGEERGNRETFGNPEIVTAVAVHSAAGFDDQASTCDLVPLDRVA